MNLTYCGKTHICGRPKNEDSFEMLEVGSRLAVFAVADGLGGLPAGEIASRIAVSALMASIRTHAPADASCPPALMRELLAGGFLAASRAIADAGAASDAQEGMATTLVVALINDSLEGVIASVGDSRAYRAGDTLVQITEDHSLVRELEKKGVITRDEARLHPDRNVVTRVICETPEPPDLAEFSLGSETLLLCTDGLTDAVSDEEIFRATKGSDVDGICTALIERSRQVNHDNTTVIVIRASPMPG